MYTYTHIYIYTHYSNIETYFLFCPRLSKHTHTRTDAGGMRTYLHTKVDMRKRIGY